MDRPARPRAPAILVVDDEPDVLLALEQTFLAFMPDVHVETASSGASALERLAARRFDLIVTDYRMPGMNGIQFLREARKAGYAGDKMLVTAYPDMHIAIEALNEERIKAFLTKPVDPDEFVSTVGHMLATIRRQRHRERAFEAALHKK